MNVVLNALENFGSTRTISNPRITAMNNQAAVLKVAQNHVYFRLNYDKTYSLNENGRDNTSVSSDIRTVPIGLVMFVQPSIDLNSDTITLFLRPTISKLSGTVNDPAVDIAISSMDNKTKGNYVPSKIPITEVREVSSVLKLKDGEIAVLGGFMEVRSSKDSKGMPLAKDLPIIGDITGTADMKDQIVELVILIRVRITRDDEQDGNLQNAADIRLQRFVPDPRPF
jgi:general secretion pathway protein D